MLFSPAAQGRYLKEHLVGIIRGHSMQPCASPWLDARIDILVSAEHVASCEQQKGQVTQAQHCTQLFSWCYLGLPAIRNTSLNKSISPAHNISCYFQSSFTGTFSNKTQNPLGGTIYFTGKSDKSKPRSFE